MKRHEAKGRQPNPEQIGGTHPGYEPVVVVWGDSAFIHNTIVGLSPQDSPQILRQGRIP
jgi:hypothetical protein